MSEADYSRLAWAVLWRSKNRLDGEGNFLICDPLLPGRVMLFETRRAAEAHIRESYGYLRNRPDLRTEPHGILAPKAVRVEVTFTMRTPEARRLAGSAPARRRNP